MSLDEYYPWLKALHVVAIVAFVGGLLATSLLLAVDNLDEPSLSEKWIVTARAFQWWDRVVTLPALLTVWVLGMSLAVTGEWFQSGWLHAKLVLVVAISALHGVQSSTLRRLASGEQRKASLLAQSAPFLILGMVAGIEILVVVKPF